MMQMFLKEEICSVLRYMIIVRFNRLYGLLILTVDMISAVCLYMFGYRFVFIC